MEHRCRVELQLLRRADYQQYPSHIAEVVEDLVCECTCDTMFTEAMG
jgi:hypothetical protein